jgi:hypothetical protein
VNPAPDADAGHLHFTTVLPPDSREVVHETLVICGGASVRAVNVPEAMGSGSVKAASVI